MNMIVTDPSLTQFQVHYPFRGSTQLHLSFLDLNIIICLKCGLTRPADMGICVSA